MNQNQEPGLQRAWTFIATLSNDLDEEQKRLDRHRQLVNATLNEIENQMLNLGIIPNNVK